MTKNTIHHATLAAASKLGIVLETTEDGIRATSKKPAFDFTIEAKAKDVLADAVAYRMIATEYDKVVIEHDDDGRWLLTVEGNDEIEALGDRLQDAFDVLSEQVQEAGITIESEDEGPSVVVPLKYKVAYAEAGHPSHCGDWLATRIDGYFDSAETGKLDEARFTAFLKENNVELTGKWSELPMSGQKGWEGRYRMNGCQKVRIQMAATGVLYLDGEAIAVPQADLEVLWAKHPSAYTDYEEAKVAAQKAKPAKRGKKVAVAEAAAA